MPPFLSNEALDDPMGVDGSQGFAGGVISATRPDIIPANALADALNIDYDDFGNVTSRFGCFSIVGNPISGTWDTSTEVWSTSTKYWGSSIPATGTVLSGFFFDTAAAERVVVAVVNGATRTLYHGNPATAFTAIAGSTFNASASYVYFAQLNERLYYCDGFGSLAYITTANANSSITAGKISRIDVINQGANLSSIPAVTIAAPPSGITATAEAVVTGTGYIAAINITNPGSGYTTAPSVSIAGGGGAHAVAYVSLSPPSKPIYLTTHTQRLFCASADTTQLPDTLYFSDILDGETWDPAGSVRVGGDGDPITGLYSWFGSRLLVFKERSIWYVDANPQQDPADWEIGIVTGNVGCVSHRSIASVGADVLFLARDGVRALSQIQAGTQTDVGVPLSAPINDLISQIDPANRAKCDAVFWRNRYMLAVPLRSGIGSQASNNAIIVYHALARAWLGKWDNWNVTDFIPTAFAADGPRLMFSGTLSTIPSSSSQLRAFADYYAGSRLSPPPASAYLDDGTGFTTSITTRAYNFQEPMVPKTGYSVQFYTENNFATPIYVSTDFAVNMTGSFTNFEAPSTIPASSPRKPVTYNLVSRGHWNCIQFKFSSASGPLAGPSRITLHSVGVTGFLDALKPEE